jgi:hypothetical protein
MTCDSSNHSWGQRPIEVKDQNVWKSPWSINSRLACWRKSRLPVIPKTGMIVATSGTSLAASFRSEKGAE